MPQFVCRFEIVCSVGLSFLPDSFLGHIVHKSDEYEGLYMPLECLFERDHRLNSYNSIETHVLRHFGSSHFGSRERIQLVRIQLPLLSESVCGKTFGL